MCTCMQKYPIFLISGILIVLLLTACGGQSPAINNPSVESATVEATSPAQPAAPLMTDTPAPTPTTAALPTEALTPTAAPAPTQAPASNAPSGDADQAVVNAMKGLLSAGPYHVKSITTLSDGKTNTMEADVILPDRYHVVMENTEVLVVGQKTYMKINGKWSEFPVDVGSIISGLRAQFTDEALKGISGATFVGSESVDNTPTKVYQFDQTIDLGSGSTAKTVAKIWISDASGLPVHMESDSDLDGVHSHTVQDITYDPNIKIEPPTQ